MTSVAWPNARLLVTRSPAERLHYFYPRFAALQPKGGAPLTTILQMAGAPRKDSLALVSLNFRSPGDGVLSANLDWAPIVRP